MISSPTNPRVKHLIRLRRRRFRDAERVTLVEGLSELRRAARAGVRIRSLYHDPGVVDRADLPDADEVIAVSSAVLSKVAIRATTEGFVAVVDQSTCRLDDLHLRGIPLLLVVESIEKPGNLGAMLRTADAAGVDAVLVADPATDVWNPNVIRASVGSVFDVPIVVATATELVGWLDDQGIALCATTPGAADSLFETDLTGPLAVAVGAEHSGLGPALLGAARVRVRIPMAGGADSLNASVSAAVTLFEAVRQRSAGGSP